MVIATKSSYPLLGFIFTFLPIFLRSDTEYVGLKLQFSLGYYCVWWENSAYTTFLFFFDKQKFQ